MMTSCRTLLCVFAVLVMASGLSMASGRGGKRGCPLRLACKMFNATSGTEVFPEKNCGCDGETTIACNLGPLTFNSRCAGELQTTFCNVEPDWTKDFPWKGMLAKACLIQAVAQGGQIYKVTPCHTGMTCDASNSLTLTVNGTAAVASYCSRTAHSRWDVFNNRPCRSESRIPGSEDTCVSLEDSQRRPHSSHSRGFKFGGHRRGRGRGGWGNNRRGG